MSPRVAEVEVDHDDGDRDGKSNKNHGEEHVATDQRERGGCRWNDVGDEKKEHDEGEQDGDGESDLLLGVGRQEEDEDGEEGDEETRHDQGHHVEERFAVQCKVEGDVDVDVLTARVLDGIPLGRRLHDLPLTVLPVVLLVHRRRLARHVDLLGVVRPGTKLHATLLLVEREVLDVDGAGALVDGRGKPRDLARVVYDRVHQELDVEVAVGTEKKKGR